MTTNLLALLKKFFGYSSFRPYQEEIINHIIARKDVLVLMPTGGGKSICYQLPAVYLEGTAVVVSPLIALMKDQVEGLINAGIPAAMLNSTMGDAERMQVKRLAMQEQIKLLYISPEGLMSEMNWLLPRMNISLFAIDEAHCISHWGHDFRPEYTQLSILKEMFPNVPMIALTATADKTTRSDILTQLKLENPKIFISSFDRPNISLVVRRQETTQAEKLSFLIRFISRRKGQSGIIYCTKRKQTETVAEYLQKSYVKAVAYHAGLTPKLRAKAQDDFINDRVDVVCATVAFGMGIDKSNVRWVVHFNMPQNIESYYQEIGRAGRDGLSSEALLFYSVGDLITLRRFADESGQKEMNQDKLHIMQRFCESDICRRRMLLSYFGEELEHDCNNCDVCKNPPTRFDGTVLVQKALSAVVRTGESVGVQMLIDILRASGRAELYERKFHLLKTYGAGVGLGFKEWREYIYQMILLGYLEIDYVNGKVLKVTSSGKKVLFGKLPAVLVSYQEKEPVVKSEKKPTTKRLMFDRAGFSVSDSELFDALSKLRKQIADREGLPAYVIFSDASLVDMVERRPTTIEAFSDVHGVGEIKLQKYGKVFVSLIRFVLRLPN